MAQSQTQFVLVSLLLQHLNVCLCLLLAVCSALSETLLLSSTCKDLLWGVISYMLCSMSYTLTAACL